MQRCCDLDPRYLAERILSGVLHWFATIGRDEVGET